MPRRRQRFGQGAVMQSSMTARKKAKCRGCNLTFEKGDPVVRLRLRKAFRNPCVTCGHRLLGVRWFHPSCVPPDANKAMGYDPAAQAYGAPQPPPSAAHAHTVAPPPKPMSPEELILAALLASEAAIKARARVIGKTPEVLKLLATYGKMKAHVLRPGNDNEQIVAIRQTMIAAIKLVTGGV